jgi:hypothetical protein
MTSVFSLRVDIDTKKGLASGVPKIRDLAKKYSLSLSFYVPVGGESNLFEIIKHRGGNFSGNHIEKLTLMEKLQSVLFPTNFAVENQELLKQIEREGHEIGVHGFKHRRWTRSLESLDLQQEFSLMNEKFRDIMGFTPNTFAAPGFRTNNKVLRALDNHGFHVASDLEGERPFRPEIDGKCKHTQVPITLRKGTQPIIENLRLSGKSDEHILNHIQSHIEEREFSSMYIHPSYEALHEYSLLEELFVFLSNSDVETTTIEQAASYFD